MRNLVSIGTVQRTRDLQRSAGDQVDLVQTHLARERRRTARLHLQRRLARRKDNICEEHAGIRSDNELRARSAADRHRFRIGRGREDAAVVVDLPGIRQGDRTQDLDVDRLTRRQRLRKIAGEHQRTNDRHAGDVVALRSLNPHDRLAQLHVVAPGVADLRRLEAFIRTDDHVVNSVIQDQPVDRRLVRRRPDRMHVRH